MYTIDVIGDRTKRDAPGKGGDFPYFRQCTERAPRAREKGTVNMMKRKLMAFVLCGCLLGSMVSLPAAHAATDKTMENTACFSVFRENLMGMLEKLFGGLGIRFGNAGHNEQEGESDRESVKEAEKEQAEEKQKESFSASEKTQEVPSAENKEEQKEEHKAEKDGKQKDQTELKEENRGKETLPDREDAKEDFVSKEQEKAEDGISAYEMEVLRLVNAERAKQGLSALTYSKELSDGAREKSLDMKQKGYFSHTSPTYGSPFDQMKARGITYRSAGENIAMGYATPEAVVNAWMNSEGHRANILSSKYTQIGIGYVKEGHYCTQWFKG